MNLLTIPSVIDRATDILRADNDAADKADLEDLAETLREAFDDLEAIYGLSRERLVSGDYEGGPFQRLDYFLRLMRKGEAE